MSYMTPDSPQFAVLPDEYEECSDCGGSTRYPCICDYFADPEDKDFYND